SVVEQLLANPLQVELGGRLQEVTVMFADLGNFTSLAEHTPPEQLLSLLNSYHGLVVGIVMEHGGTIDKFLGDGLMVLFNTPLEQDDHIERAVQAALGVRAALPDFHAKFEASQRLTINFGIHTGMAVVGNVGTSEIMDFTAVGDTVNVASRLQSLSGNNQILISGAVYDRIADHTTVNQIGEVNIKGRVEPILVYEVLE
ncbi:MAG: adenylate/guanylate cyclase domain-containing protein, partial [Chloroflexi bacterium]